MRFIRHLLPILALIISTPLAATPQVVTSIKPINDLVHAVMEGVGEPVRLIPPGSSPHTYALKPSERLALEKADILFWIGPEVETTLAKASKTLRPDARIITLSTLPDIELLPARTGGDWEKHEHAHGHEHAHAHGHGHGHEAQHHHHGTSFDGHLWLSPANASMIVRAASSIHSAADPEHAPQYAANAEQAIRRLTALDDELKKKLAPVAAKPFIVFHDAYQYFEHTYGLRAVGSILVSPEAMASVGRVQAMREKIKKLGAVCVFSEPQFEPKLVQTLIEGTQARSGTLDPLGAKLPPGLAGYEQLLQQLADNLTSCLASMP
ncbi:MAG: zinc ABC transporter substrate-binding protein [Gammaproteobacteria bacterium]|nr:zinc ABC transporter substrate-binding protein [Gammaproteobacteria bacterium]